jgi:hypothetical protein
MVGREGKGRDAKGITCRKEGVATSMNETW